MKMCRIIFISFYWYKIIAIAKKQNIPVKQMKVDRGAYDLHAE